MSSNLIVTIDTPTNPCGDVRRKYEQYYQKGTHKLVQANGEEIPISDHVLEVLQQILPHLEQGRTTVTISPADAEMTTQEAADILNISRPHLVKLLKENEIPYVKTGSKTGSHRRLKVKDVMEYKQKKDTRYRQSLDDMKEIMQESGLFD